MSTPMMPPEGGPQPHDSNRRRWIIVGVSFAAVVALVVGLLVWQSGSSADSGAPSADAVDRTVGLLTEKDPVCDDWIRYADELARDTKAWSGIDKTIPASSWSAEQRRTFEDAAAILEAATDRFERLLPEAKNVTLQELIAQTIVYWRQYVAAIPSYVQSDAAHSRVARNLGGAVTYMCTAAPIVSSVGDSVDGRKSQISHAATLEPFMTTVDPLCGDFVQFMQRQNDVLAGWEATDPNVPATEWSPGQTQLNRAANEVMSQSAQQAKQWSDQTSNPIFSDLLYAYSAYVQAYVAKSATYRPDDNQIWRVATLIAGGLAGACELR